MGFGIAMVSDMKRDEAEINDKNTIIKCRKTIRSADLISALFKWFSQKDMKVCCFMGKLFFFHSNLVDLIILKSELSGSKKLKDCHGIQELSIESEKQLF